MRPMGYRQLPFCFTTLLLFRTSAVSPLPIELMCLLYYSGHCVFVVMVWPVVLCHRTSMSVQVGVCVYFIDLCPSLPPLPTAFPPSGFSGVCPNFYPWLVVWMCEHREEPEAKRTKMQRFISVTDRVVHNKVMLLFNSS